MFVRHFQFTYEEYRGTGVYIDRGDFKAVPRMYCHTGDAHAVGSRDWDKVTCEHCLLRKPKIVKPPTAQEILDLL